MRRWKKRTFLTTSGCVYKWGGWGGLRVDGARQNNSGRSEGPWDRATEVARTDVHKHVASPDTERGRDAASGGHEGRGKPVPTENSVG